MTSRRPWRSPNRSGECFYADDAGIVSRSRNSLAKMMTVTVIMCTSFGFSLGSQDGNHIPDDEVYGQGRFRY